MRFRFTSFVRVPLCLLAAVSMVFNGCQPSSPDPRTEAANPAQIVPIDGSDLRVSGPYQHGNLSVFLVHGKNTTSEEFITLDEGLKSGTVVLSEQGTTAGNTAPQVLIDGISNDPPAPVQASPPDEVFQDDLSQIIESSFAQNIAGSGATVNTLTVENTSDRPVYIQAGDIVKGGKQDRTIAVDIVIAPKSGKVPLEAFCVEQGRWSNRSGDTAEIGLFLTNSFAVNSKSLKLAVRHSKSQSLVWDNVAKIQTDLSGNVATLVNDAGSPTSLQLALENETLKESVESYREDLEGIVEKHDDVIGYAFAINGRLNSADVYASNKLFTKLWPKLLNASTTEAIAELKGEKGEKACVVADVIGCFKDADQGKATTKDLVNGVQNVSRESDKNFLFETRLGDVSLRKNYLTK